MVDLAEEYLANGQIESCIQVARQILKFDLLVEDGHRLLLQSFAAQHDQVKMVRHFQEYEKILDDELGLRPSAGFLALFEELMQQL